MRKLVIAKHFDDILAKLLISSVGFGIRSSLTVVHQQVVHHLLEPSLILADIGFYRTFVAILMLELLLLKESKQPWCRELVALKSLN